MYHHGDSFKLTDDLKSNCNLEYCTLIFVWYTGMLQVIKKLNLRLFRGLHNECNSVTIFNQTISRKG